MLTDSNLCDLCADCYSATETFDRVIDIAGVWAGVKFYDDCVAIAFRGSITINDWLRDFHGRIFQDAELGGVEEGFLLGIRDAKAHLDKVIPFGKPLYITGHSLGAAHACIFAALWHLSEEITTAIALFGCPRPGTDMLRGLLSATPIRSYRNGSDPVPELPLTLPGAPYCHVRDLITVREAPTGDDLWHFAAWHHIELYQAAIKSLCAPF